MPSHPRRRFLKQTVAAASGLALTTSCQQSPSASPPGTEDTPAGRPPFDASELEALARLVLPSAEMSEIELADRAQSFKDWIEGFRPVAEQNLPYLVTDEIPYGPPDPAPQWRAQLEALNLEARKRFEAEFAALPAEHQSQILRNQMPRDLPARLPQTPYASHVAIAMMAHYFHSTEANDRCYQRAIGRQTCRGLDTSAELPKPLDETATAPGKS